ncbi:MAG: FtsQ-type POTRA domain-containing protein [Acidimicrobiales bacterium]|nr:FtsQ-type POTRA domain-containing protein [Acidimicrobiales bacterium]
MSRDGGRGQGGGGEAHFLATASGSASAIDPRIRARRIEVQRDVGRQRLRRVVDAGLLLAVAAGFLVALRSPLLDVEELQISGARRSGLHAVVEAAGISVGDQLFDLRPGTVGRSVAALPWVREVTVDRGISGVVRIAVEERTAVAIVGDGDAAALVDAEGRVLAPVADAPDLGGRLVTVVGLPGDLAPGRFLAEEARDALEVAMRLAEAVPGAVSEVVVGDGLVARLVDGGEARLGDATRLGAKIRSLETVLTQVDLSCLAVADLRVPGSPVLTREEPCS